MQSLHFSCKQFVKTIGFLQLGNYLSDEVKSRAFSFGAAASIFAKKGKSQNLMDINSYQHWSRQSKRMHCVSRLQDPSLATVHQTESRTWWSWWHLEPGSSSHPDIRHSPPGIHKTKLHDSLHLFKGYFNFSCVKNIFLRNTICIFPKEKETPWKLSKQLKLNKKLTNLRK